MLRKNAFFNSVTVLIILMGRGLSCSGGGVGSGVFGSMNSSVGDSGADDMLNGRVKRVGPLGC